MSFWHDKQWRNACIKSRACLFNPCPWQMSQSAFFSVISSVWLYSDRKPRACQKLGNSPGVGKCPVPGQRKICKCTTPWTKKAGKCSAVARRREVGGGGGGSWAQLEMTDAWRPTYREIFTLLMIKYYLFLKLFFTKYFWVLSFFSRNMWNYVMSLPSPVTLSYLSSELRPSLKVEIRTITDYWR